MGREDVFFDTDSKIRFFDLRFKAHLFFEEVLSLSRKNPNLPVPTHSYSSDASPSSASRRRNAALSEFETAHTLFVRHHRSRRSGERRSRLDRGYLYAEKLFLERVWWPLVGSFEHLHPEYEIQDWNRNSQFLDFAFLPKNGGKIGIECDSFQSHTKDMDREKFSYALNRDSFLMGMGWKILHFSFDDIQRRPEVCRMLLQLNLSPTVIRSHGSAAEEQSANPERLSPLQKDVLKLAWQITRPLRPRDVMERYDLSFRPAKQLLQDLVARNLLTPRYAGKQIRGYEPIGRFPMHFFE